MEVYNTKGRVGKGWGNIRKLSQNTEYKHRIGTFTFDKGIVAIYDEPAITSFTFIVNGISYTRVLSKKKKQYTDNGLIRMAAKYGREIIINNP